MTTPGRYSTVARFCTESSQLQVEVSQLASEIDSFQAPHDELDLFRQCFSDLDAVIDFLCAVMTSFCSLLDGGLTGPGFQYYSSFRFWILDFPGLWN